ncbi:hypothetical protein ACKKBG_A04690 [Auxenochlorella protothecoides x Auxenochlorella symbiontica]
MQIFLRGLSGRTRVLEVDSASSIADLQLRIQDVEHVSPADQVLVAGGRLMSGDHTIESSSLSHGSTLHLSSRLRGGVPVKVKIITPHLACGNEVTIDLEPTATKDEIKLKLVDATGVPFEHQKVLLSGINQIALGDKRTNIGFASCGSANGVQMAVNAK